MNTKFLSELKLVDCPEFASVSLDSLYGYTDHFLIFGKFEEVDELVNEFLEYDFTLQLYIGFLIGMFPYRARLANYTKIYKQALKLAKNAEYSDIEIRTLLGGLEKE